MQPAFLLWPTTFAEDKLLVFGIAYFTKKPLHRAGAVTVMKEKKFIRGGISKGKGSMVIHRHGLHGFGFSIRSQELKTAAEKKYRKLTVRRVSFGFFTGTGNNFWTVWTLDE